MLTCCSSQWRTQSRPTTFCSCKLSRSVEILHSQLSITIRLSLLIDLSISLLYIVPMTARDTRCIGALQDIVCANGFGFTGGKQRAGTRPVNTACGQAGEKLTDIQRLSFHQHKYRNHLQSLTRLVTIYLPFSVYFWL
jgi:hypothetical protein